MIWSDIFAAFRWWVILMIIGSAAVPLGYWLFGRLPDKGYAFSKMLGLLVISYIFWILTSLGFLNNDIGGILFALLGLVGLSIYFYRQTEGQLGTWLREHKGYILTAEVAFTLLYIVWVWVRANNPSITATEKPMEFAFLNSIGRSPVFPPQDPWLSGFSISYYYFGYVMTSVLLRLAAVPEMIAFNLAIAWLVAGSGLGAFGLVYNLVAALKETAGNALSVATSKLGVTIALLAFVALPLAGNNQMLLEVLHGNGIGSEQFWSWLNVQDIDGPATNTPRYLTPNDEPSSVWWWWRSSRVIREYHLSGRWEEGLTPIAEFPGFSFILGDMHPHVLALPFAFLTLGLALSWYLRRPNDENEITEGEGFFRAVHLLLREIGYGRLLATAVIVGGLSFLNTWDVLIHLFVIGGAFALTRWQQYGRFDGRVFSETLVVGFVLGIIAYALYYPFYMGFRSQAGAPFILPMLMRPTRLPHFLIIFGMPLLSIIIFLATLLAKSSWRGWLAALTSFFVVPLGLFFIMLLWSIGIAVSPAGYGLINGILNELNISIGAPTGSYFSWGIDAVIALLPTIISVRLYYIGLTVFLSAIIATVVLLWNGRLHRSETLQAENKAPAVIPFVLLLIFTAALLTLGPEYVYLKDNFGQRLNTIFKFYYQAWILYGVAALFGLGYLWQRAKAVGTVATIGYVALLAVAMMFPYRGALSRSVEFRGPLNSETRRPLTLNGLAFLESFNPDEYDAIIWLRENAAPSAVVLEATGNPYSNYARVSANTGLPTILGWANHEYQWRGDSTDEPSRRGPIVKEMYDTLDWGRTAVLLNDYDVQYIFVGSIERNDHSAQGLEKFAHLEVAYANNSVVIYRWQPQ